MNNNAQCKKIQFPRRMFQSVIELNHMWTVKIQDKRNPLHTHLPHKFIRTGGSDRLLRLPLVVFTQYVLWEDFLQLTHRVGARAASLHAAQLRLQHEHSDTRYYKSTDYRVQWFNLKYVNGGRQKCKAAFIIM